MHDYTYFPPIESFTNVLKNSPRAALAYVDLYKLKSKKRLSIQKTSIKNSFLISITVFRNHLVALARLALISFEENADSFLIDFYENRHA